MKQLELCSLGEKEKQNERGKAERICQCLDEVQRPKAILRFTLTFFADWALCLWMSQIYLFVMTPIRKWKPIL